MHFQLFIFPGFFDWEKPFLDCSDLNPECLSILYEVTADLFTFCEKLEFSLFDVHFHHYNLLDELC